MADEPIEKSKSIEVATQVVKKGNTRFLSRAAFDNPPPNKLRIAVRAIQGTIVALLPFIGGSDYFSGGKVKAINFWFGVVGILCEGILRSTGVESTKDTKKRLEDN